MGEHRVQFFDSIGRSCTKLLTSLLELGASLRKLLELEQSNRRETSPRISASTRPPTTIKHSLLTGKSYQFLFQIATTLRSYFVDFLENLLL